MRAKWLKKPKELFITKEQKEQRNSRWSKHEYTYLYNTWRWRKLRKVQLELHPLCMRCKRNYTKEIDHIMPLSVIILKYPNEVVRRFYDKDNLQSLCTACHRSKNTEDKKLLRATRDEIKG